MRRRWQWLTVFAVGVAGMAVTLYASASYPSSVKAFTTRVAGDTIQPAHINDLQDEVTAIEGALLNGFSHVLKDASGTRTRFMQSMARASESGSQSLAHNTVTTLTFSGENFDTDTLHDTSSNTGRLTAVIAGKYLVIGMAVYANNATGIRQLSIRVNGATTQNESQVPGQNSGDCAVVVMDVISLSASDYVELRGLQDSGGALNVTKASFSMVYVGE